MNVSIIKKSQFQTSSWSGGSTTQLYISPADSNYSGRNFDVRISTAKVEVEKSIFTSLPGINRKLMILEGEILLSHKGQHTKQLKPLEVDSFKGDWTTTSIGTCVDFNVMTRGKIQSELFGLKIDAKTRSQIEIEEKWDTLCMYAISGTMEIEIDHTNYLLDQGNLMVINGTTPSIFPIHSVNESQIAIVKLAEPA